MIRVKHAAGVAVFVTIWIGAVVVYNVKRVFRDKNKRYP